MIWFLLIFPVVILTLFAGNAITYRLGRWLRKELRLMKYRRLGIKRLRGRQRIARRARFTGPKFPVEYQLELPDP